MHQEGRKRQASALALLLYERPADDGRNEVLHTKVFSLVMSGNYRSHAYTLFQYSAGSWGQVDGIGAILLDGFLQVVRYAQACFLLLATAKPHRHVDAIAREMKMIHEYAPPDLIAATFLADVSNKKTKSKVDNWCFSCSDLCKMLHGHFAE